MEVGFFFWPYDTALIRSMAEAADAFGYDMVGIADTPGNAMDPWVATTLLAAAARRARVAVCVTNLVTRHPAISAASTASIELLAPGRVVLGIGVGHSGTKNLGMASLPAGELAEGVTFIRELLRGRAVTYRGGTAQLPWVKHPSPVFLAASHPASLRAAGAAADGAFINYGLGADNVRESEGAVAQAASEAGRRPDDVEIWQIAGMDCNEDGDAARRKIGAILAFVAAYVVGRGDPARRGVPPEHREALRALRRRYSTRPGDAARRKIGAILAFVAAYVVGGGDPARRGVPPEHREPLRELRRRYSMRPSDADAALVAELGLFDYLARRLAVCGTPEECLAQVRAAQEAGVRRLMFSVSLAIDPVRAIRLFGEKVLPALRTRLA